MGRATDSDAVVDSKLQVLGIEGLRVVDASVMPTIVSGNTQAATIVIAEKGAAMMKEHWITEAENQKPGYKKEVVDQFRTGKDGDIEGPETKGELWYHFTTCAVNCDESVVLSNKSNQTITMQLLEWETGIRNKKNPHIF